MNNIIRPWDFLTALFNGDLTSEGGYLDQLKSGSLIENNYMDAGARGLKDVNFETGEGALAAYSSLIGSGAKLSPESQEAFNNLLSTQATSNAQRFSQTMRDTELLSSAAQLSNLGLSPSGLSGAVAHANGVGAASVGNGNPSLSKFEAQSAIAKSIIGMAGSMASSGIHGASTLAVKNLAGKIAASAASSALSASRHWR